MACIRMCLGALLLLPLAGEETVQVFVNADGNRDTGYGYGGTDYIVREALVEQSCGSGGWGRRVECYVELYEHDKWVATYPYECELTCCSADLDLDGNVNLADYALFQEAFNGTR